MFVILWLVCSVLSAGFLFAYAQRSWPNIAKKYYKEDLFLAYSYGLIGGPLMLATVVLTLSFKKGIKFW